MPYNPTRTYFHIGIWYIRFFHAEDTRRKLQREYATDDELASFERIVKESEMPTQKEWARFVEDGYPQAPREEYLVQRNPGLKGAARQLKGLVVKTGDLLSEFISPR
ncbi:hypothetical protein FMUND_7624 [Fusarium mundagurra]|uniref:Uncharacterized protein n=1 Tax=Fusarium mundagurra TaxID=1567541 RepID=A0A8H5YK28_9HYPO|nr:hypothetical protein FMUND_7624 [Fusarium mundagurra]